MYTEGQLKYSHKSVRQPSFTTAAIQKNTFYSEQLQETQANFIYVSHAYTCFLMTVLLPKGFFLHFGTPSSSRQAE